MLLCTTSIAMVKNGNKEIEYINAIREVEEKWNSTEEELKWR